MDIIFALCALVLLSPLLALLSLIIRLRLGSPILFVQHRPGLGSAPFRLRKFRSMTDARSSDGQLLPDSARVTRFGQWLRSTSLDELPEFWNVLVGDMSLIGPRPLLMEYLTLYSKEQARRHEVRPGLTGWAQTNGRNAITWSEKFKLDVWYVDNRSLLLDIRIVWRTVLALIRRADINEPGEATMSAFAGVGKDTKCDG